MNDQRRARQQYQNKVNNAQGHFFEGAIKAACALYSERERADIEKTPEPFRVLEKFANGIFKGRFTARAQPDFQGTLAGGRSIVFEAKYTTTDRMKRDVLTPDQKKALERHARRGAVAAVCAGIGNDFFFVPWEIWRDMKERFGRQYVTVADLETWRVRFNGAVLFLDYMHDGAKFVFKEQCGVYWKPGDMREIAMRILQETEGGGNEEPETAQAENDGPGHTANGL